MKKTFQLKMAILAIAFAGFIFSCKKDSSSNSGNNTATLTDLSAQADDQTIVSDENENLTNDINAALSSQVSINGDARTASPESGTTGVNSTTASNGVSGANGNLICDASVTFDTVSNPRTVTITYDGTNCWGNRTRTGVITIAIASGVHWHDQGAVVYVSVQNLKITRLIDSKSITINGYKMITNTSGGSLNHLSSLSSITHDIRDSISVQFNDTSTRVWQASKQRVFTYNNGIVVTTTGTHSDANHTGIAEWGKNRFGIEFTTIITQPLVIRQDCDFRLVSGQAQILRSDNLNTTITFGLDSSGNPTGCPGTGHYYLQVIWIASNGRSYPILLPYGY